MPEPPVRVLIADDHPIFRDGVRAVLAPSAEFHVIGQAGNGQSAVELVLALQPDVLLLDVALPDISGHEVLRRLREGRSRAATLLLTGAIDREQTLEALALGARGVVMKSSAADVLLAAMRTILRGEYWVGRQVMVEWAAYARERAQPRQRLTGRERAIITRVIGGLTNREIAGALGVGKETVKTHVSSIFRKLGVSNRIELVLYVTSGKLGEPTANGSWEPQKDWAAVLDEYNNGLYPGGPPHCGDEAIGQ